MEKKIRIREMKETDIGACVSIFIEGSNCVFKENWNKKRAKKYLSWLFKGSGLCYCAESNNNVIGFAMGHIYPWWDGDRFLLKEIFIDSAWRGKGIGTMLLEHVEKEAKKMGVAHVELFTMKTAKAFKFYMKRGFSDTGLTLLEKRIGSSRTITPSRTSCSLRKPALP